MLKKGVDIHDYDRRVFLSTRKVEDCPLISEANKKAIFSFIDDCRTRNISKARLDFYLNRLYLIAQWCKKDFKDLCKDDMKVLVSKINSRDYTENTKMDYRLTLKTFFRFIRGIEARGVYPEEVRWIPINTGGSHKKLPEDLLTQEDVESMINHAEHPRDKAFIATLYETGCRIGELASLQIKSVTIDKYGVIIVVTGKTGMRRVRMISYASYLSIWLSMHPDRNDPQAPLWVVIGTTKGIAKKKLKGYKFNWSYALRYNAMSKILERAATKAGITKPINPHHFRHSRATKLANSLTEAQLKEFFGWTQSSDMASVYVHLSGRDVDDALLKLYGLKEKAPEEEHDKPTRCPRCSEINPPNFKFCGKCGMALDLKAVMEKEDKMKAALSFMDESIDDKDLDKKLEEWVNKKVDAALKERLKKIA
jgi:integrase